VNTQASSGAGDEQDQPRPLFSLRFKQAEALADATSVLLDLRLAATALDRLIKLLGEKSDDDLVKGSLWTTAVVSYSRCFIGGRRPPLGESVFEGFHESALGFHRHLITMRDKHVAHSVNPFEQVAVGAVVGNDEAGIHRVIGMGVLAVKHVMFDDQGVSDFRHLVGGLESKIAATCKALEAAVLAEAQTRTVEEILAMPRLGITAPGPSDATTARR
jgi:hypothetical protein